MNASAAIADPLLRRAFADGLAPRTLTVLLGTGGLLVWRLSLSEERARRPKARRSSGSAIAAEAFMNHAGEASVVQSLHKTHPTDLANPSATHSSQRQE